MAEERSHLEKIWHQIDFLEVSNPEKRHELAKKLDPLGINTPEFRNHLVEKIDFMELRNQ